jgi:hypothetical protein
MIPGFSSSVMPGLVPGIHAFFAWRFKDVDGRNKCGHDEGGACRIAAERRAR